MFAVVGTVPLKDFPLIEGTISLSSDVLEIQTRSLEINRGTPALLATAAQVCDFFKKPKPFAYLVGDIGSGSGSRKLYAYLEKLLPDRTYKNLTFHYIQPDVDWHNRVLFAIHRMADPPTLIADAGFMYAAKMSGQANDYDLFTPDIGELAFLADASAPHPFYTRGFIFHEAGRVPEMIEAAYTHHNAARYLLVKGEKDFLADANGIIEAISHPVIPSMEAIGGTGDMITGLVAAFTGMGKDVKTACLYASRICRLAGEIARPDPGTQVIDIIHYLPYVLEQFFTNESLDN